MTDLSAVIDGNLSNVKQCGRKRCHASRVIVEGVDRAPQDEWNQHAGEAFTKEFFLILDWEKEESRNHHKERHADAQKRVHPTGRPGTGRVQHRTVRADVLELTGV